MPRELRPELEDLISSGHCNWHTCFDIVLTGGTELFLSTGEIYVNRFGKDQQYLAKVRPDVDELEMSLDLEMDGIKFKVSNVDMVIGRTLTTSTRKLDGAEAIVGILFIEKGQPLEQAIWDAKMPGQLVSGEVVDEDVDFTLISIVDGIIVAGRTIADEFQWQEPISNVPDSDPNDLNPRDPGNLDIEPNRRRGRYLDYEPMVLTL